MCAKTPKVVKKVISPVKSIGKALAPKVKVPDAPPPPPPPAAAPAPALPGAQEVRLPKSVQASAIGNSRRGRSSLRIPLNAGIQRSGRSGINIPI